MRPETKYDPGLQPHSFCTEAMRWNVLSKDCCSESEVSTTRKERRN
jgi:hypothetical protein